MKKKRIEKGQYKGNQNEIRDKYVSFPCIFFDNYATFH